MAETVTYVNRSNLATFLKKIKELIPSSLTFLTKTEAEETYQEKLKHYTEDEDGDDATMRVTWDDGTSGALGVNKNNVALAGAGVPVVLGAIYADISLEATNGNINLVTNEKATLNDSEILTGDSVVDSLDSTSTTKPLSANQGKVLNEKFDDIITKDEVITNTDVAFLSRIFALPLETYVGAGLYQPSTSTIGKYSAMFSSLEDGELVVCEYEGVKGLYAYQGSSQIYCFTQYIADLKDIPTGVEDSLTSSSTAKALSANQGKVLDEGKQDKLSYYSEPSSTYPIAQVDCGAYSQTSGTGLTLHTNPTSASENYAQIDVLSGSSGTSSLKLDKDGVYHNGRSLDDVNHLWMCAGKNAPGTRDSLLPSKGTPSEGDYILWITVDATLCATTIQPLLINAVSDDGQTITYSPVTSWL